MKILSPLLAFTSLAFGRDTRSLLNGDRVISVSSQTEAHKFLHEIAADHLGFAPDGSVQNFRVTPEQIQQLHEAHHFFDDNTEEYSERMDRRLNNLEPDFRMCLDGASCAHREAQDFYAEYQPLESLWARMEILANTSDIAEIGSIGLSYEGRDQKSIEISTADEEKPLVFYFCNIHAREWLTPMFCMYMAETLAADGGHPLTDIFDFTIVVSANPDGYAFTWVGDIYWRKTRKPNNGTDCIGTDPNRNYPVNFMGPGSSGDPCTQVYYGEEPLDQAETFNVAAYITANKERIISVNDIHSYSSMWMSAYGGYYQTPPQEDFDAMMTCSEAAVDAIESVSGDRWGYGSISGTLYLEAGNSVDWIYAEAGVLHAYTAELRGIEFQPNSTNIVPSNLEMFAAMQASLECVAAMELGIGTEAPNAGTPTSYPITACVDSDPTGIVHGDGSYAPCDELGEWCADLDFVRDACPVTCGSCPTELPPGFTASPTVPSTSAPTAVPNTELPTGTPTDTFVTDAPTTAAPATGAPTEGAISLSPMQQPVGADGAGELHDDSDSSLSEKETYLVASICLLALFIVILALFLRQDTGTKPESETSEIKKGDVLVH